MPDAPPKASRATCWMAPCAFLGVYVALLALTSLTVADHARRAGWPADEMAPRATLALVIVETVGISVGVPFFFASCRERVGPRAAVGRVLAPAVALVAAGFVACAATARGGVPLAAIAWAHAFLLAFALFLASLTAFLARVGLRPATAQLVASALALAMVGSVLYANPAVEAAKGERARTLVINAVLWTSPWAIAAGSILQADPIRFEHLYSWSVIKYYSFSYPGARIGSVALRSAAVSGVYLGAALALLALRRWRR